MKSIIKILTIVFGAFVALILTRMGISYLLVLVLLGLIMPLFTNDKKSAVLSGILYATVGYIISYPSGLFLSNYMPNIEIPISVSSLEVATNLFTGWFVPVIIAIVICFLTSVVGKYVSGLIKNNKETEEKGYYFNRDDEFEDESVEEYEFNPQGKKNFLDLSPIQKAKNKRKYDKEE